MASVVRSEQARAGGQVSVIRADGGLKVWHECREDELTATTTSGLIRQADDADLPALAIDFGPEGLYRDRLKRQAAGKGVLLTYCLDESGPPMGVVYVWLEDAEEPEVREELPGVPLLMHLKVHHDMRGWGIGTALVREAERLVVGRGGERIALGVDPNNINAISLYTRLGYQEWPHGLVATHQVEFHKRRRRRYNEECRIFVKQLVAEPVKADATLVSAVVGG